MSTTPASPRRHRAAKARHGASRVRFAPMAIATGVAASAAIALSTSGALAGFVAQITNDSNNAATGYIAMQEQLIVNGSATTSCTSNGSGVSNNTATCSTINKYGGSAAMVPGVPVTTTIKITNTGTVAANTFTLAPGACTQSNNGSVNGSATDLCSKMTVSLTQDGTAVPGASGTLTSIAGKTVALTGPIAANGGNSTFVFTVTLPAQATAQAPLADNPYQGLRASQNLVWQFTS